MLKLAIGGLIAAAIIMALVFIVGPILLIGAAVFFGIVPLHKHFRYKMLLQKYGNASLARMLADKTIWENQTAEQLNDALGSPLGVSQQDGLEVRTYRILSLGRFNTRVTLENGLVKSWVSA